MLEIFKIVRAADSYYQDQGEEFMRGYRVCYNNLINCYKKSDHFNQVAALHEKDAKIRELEREIEGLKKIKNEAKEHTFESKYLKLKPLLINLEKSVARGNRKIKILKEIVDKYNLKYEYIRACQQNSIETDNDS